MAKKRMLLLLLSRFSCVQLCATPQTAAPQAPLVPGILQARILEWVAISFSNACMHAKSLQSCPTLCDPMDSSPQAPLSPGFSRQEYWSGLPFPSPKEKDEQYLIKDGILIQIKFPNVFHTSVLNIRGTEERPHIQMKANDLKLVANMLPNKNQLPHQNYSLTREPKAEKEMEN